MGATTAATLGDLVSHVETYRKTVRVCNFTGTDQQLEAIVSHFEPHDIDVELTSAADRPANVVDLVDDGRVEATTEAEEMLRYVRAWENAFSEGLREEPPEVVDGLNDTFFESYDKRRMIMASRIVEFRGLNRGVGELHVGFQNLAKIDFQRSTYQHLSQSGLDVHVYGKSSPETTADLDLVVHGNTDREVAIHWWVAFDGNGDDDEKVVLLAQEREPNRFFGFWTYDARVVDDVLERMPALQR